MVVDIIMNMPTGILRADMVNLVLCVAVGVRESKHIASGT